MSEYVLYRKNDYCVANKEFFKDCGDEVEGHHDPSQATVFHTVKKANELKRHLAIDGIKVMKLAKAISEYKNSPSLYRTIPKIKPELNVPYDRSMSVQDVLDYRYKCKKAEHFEIPSNVYGGYPNLYSITSYLWTVEAYNSKDHKDKFVTVSIKVPRHGDYDEFLKEFKLIIDRCDFTDGGYKIFPITDHELCEYESRYLYYKSEDDCKIFASQRERYSGTLKEMFNLIKSMYYYE